MDINLNSEGSLELWLSVVRRIIGRSTKKLSLLDLGCNEMTGTRHLRFGNVTAVDVEDCPLRPREFNFVQKDALEFVREHRSDWFDVIIASDFIEHLDKHTAFRLLARTILLTNLEIIFTPLGDYCVNPNATSPHEHRSGWMPEELERIGFKTEVYPNWHPTLQTGAFFAWRDRR